MSSGCFPVQSGTSCANEWIQDGVTGLIVEDLTVEGVSSALLRALTDNELVDTGARRNHEVCADRLLEATVRQKALTYYALDSE
jgi:hypothetical protein